MITRGKDVDEFYTVQRQRQTGICIRDRGIASQDEETRRTGQDNMTGRNKDVDNLYTVIEAGMNRNLKKQRHGQPLHWNGDRDEPEFEYDIEKLKSRDRGLKLKQAGHQKSLTRFGNLKADIQRSKDKNN